MLTKHQFSDEFEDDGRTFYDGDDPYFQAVDLWYGVTQDLEVLAFLPFYPLRSSLALTLASGTTQMLSARRTVQ